MSTYNQLDLQALGSQPIMPKNLPDHCSGIFKIGGVSESQLTMHRAWGLPLT